MTLLEKNIIATINEAVKKSSYGSYITIQAFLSCISAHYKGDARQVMDKMIAKKLAYLSKTGKAITLMRGLQDDFSPFNSVSEYDITKFTERFAEQAVADFGVIPNEQWILKYGYNMLYVHETRKPSYTLYDVKAIALNKYHTMDEMLNNYKMVLTTVPEVKEAKTIPMPEPKTLTTAEKTFCVCFIETETMTEIDSGEVSEYDTEKTELIRFFDTQKEAGDFSRKMSAGEYDFDNEEENNIDDWEYEYSQWSYEVIYSGEYNPAIHKGKNRLLPCEG